MMSSKMLDTDSILSENEQWTKLDLEWGDPVDLDTEEDQKLSPLSPVLSNLDLRKTTFDSSFLFKQVQKSSKRSLPSPKDYKDFLQDLNEDEYKDIPVKQFYFISGQILSAFSVEEICQNIDDIFKSVEQLCSATSTLRFKKPRLQHPKKKIPEVIQCSISAGDLSFDDTEEYEKEKGDSDDINMFIDEAFEQLNSTLASIANISHDDITNTQNSKEDAEQSVRELEESIRESVTTLVKKFSTLLGNPMSRSPKKKRRCNDKFKELTEFWRSKTCEGQ